LKAESFERFYLASYSRLVGQVFALLGDLKEAEDVAQDAFAQGVV
jgi:RNA polymerase sigma-70 factor, ECF subfamily